VHMERSRTIGANSLVQEHASGGFTYMYMFRHGRG
jgi:hypothetical protein